MKDNLLNELEKIIKENESLHAEVMDLKSLNQKILLRERLYQSELSKIRGALSTLSKSIDTTPHSRNEEYQKYYESENPELLKGRE